MIIWGGNYFSLPVSRGWLVWNKPAGGFTLAEAELAWTNVDTAIRVFDAHRSDPDREHPTQKPLALMAWCVAPLKGETVLDPFCGSGTTLVAAHPLDRIGYGVEISPEYVAVTLERLAGLGLKPELISEAA